jgi:CDP-diacylglycerol--serine O-phosphatidyltransferase
VSRLPTIALKAVHVPPQLVLPLLVLLVVGVAALFYEPHLILLLGLAVYLLHLPYAAWRYQHLRRHPELWDADARRQVARAARRPLRMAVRMPRRRRVAGRDLSGSPLPRSRRLGRLRPGRVPRRGRED